MVCFRCGSPDKDQDVIGQTGRARCPLCGKSGVRPVVQLDEPPGSDVRLVWLVPGDVAGPSDRNE